MEVGLVVAAFALGLGARAVGLPPLVGYLVAGFALHGLDFETTDTIEVAADLGVLLLLFGIGLKLKLGSLLEPAVWGSAGSVAIGATGLFAGVLLAVGALGLGLASDLDLRTAAIVGFALSFSSTVFAVKSLEETNETGSLAGRLAVGVLILQDVFAVVFLVASDGNLPSPWALAVIPGFFVARPVAGWLLDHSGHGEILMLLGLALALGAGAGAFELVGLKPDLGALVAGFLLSRHPRAEELADRLLALKDVFLVAFFLSIGLQGTPPTSAWLIGILVLAFIPLRSFGFFWLFTRFRLRARTAVHGSLNLSTYSEFGLIVGAAAASEGLLDNDWVSMIAVAVAGSFILASAANSMRYRIYGRWSAQLKRFQRHPTAEGDAVLDCRAARSVVFGMGRVGTGAFDEMTARGRAVIGIDRSRESVAHHLASGRTVVQGDPLDRDFWDRVQFHPEVQLVIASTNSHSANLALVDRVREFLPQARIAAIASYPDQIAELRAAGVDVARNLYEEAGQALADDAIGVVFGGDGRS
jgi:predicted Kef-type K+ transport protein